jgi:hypothetical protein
MGLGLGYAGRTDRDLSQWNHHTRLMYWNQLCLTTLIMYIDLFKRPARVSQTLHILPNAQPGLDKCRHEIGEDWIGCPSLSLKGISGFGGVIMY